MLMPLQSKQNMWSFCSLGGSRYQDSRSPNQELLHEKLLESDLSVTANLTTYPVHRSVGCPWESDELSRALCGSWDTTSALLWIGSSIRIKAPRHQTAVSAWSKHLNMSRTFPAFQRRNPHEPQTPQLCVTRGVTIHKCHLETPGYFPQSCALVAWKPYCW